MVPQRGTGAFATYLALCPNFVALLVMTATMADTYKLYLIKVETSEVPGRMDKCWPSVWLLAARLIPDPVHVSANHLCSLALLVVVDGPLDGRTRQHWRRWKFRRHECPWLLRHLCSPRVVLLSWVGWLGTLAIDTGWLSTLWSPVGLPKC